MIEYLNYEGKKLPVKIGYYALKMLKAELGKEMSDIGDDDFTAYEILLFYGLEMGCRKTHTKFTWKKTDMEMLMEEVFYQFLDLLPKFFPEFDVKKFQAVMEEVKK